MDRVRALIRQAERDAAVIDAVWHALASLRLIHFGRIHIEDSGLVIDLRDDIQRLTAALMLLGYPGHSDQNI